MVGGQSANGNAEHRYLVRAMLDAFGEQITRIITCEPQPRPLLTRLKRLLKRGHYLERIARARYGKGYGPDGAALSKALFAANPVEVMPGGDRVTAVTSHNSAECQRILAAEQPVVIVVYGTAILQPQIFALAERATLNMHTGLSPHYRGDSTLFWPVFYDDRENLGVTVHKLVAAVDGGDIVYTGKVNYQSGDGEAELFAKGVKLGTELYVQAVQDVLDGSVKYHPQDLSVGREFRWIHRTVAAEETVRKTLQRWAQQTS